MLVVVVLAVAWPLNAQVPEELEEATRSVTRPSSAGRIVRHFDFEERDFNAFEVPLYWIRAQNDPEVRRRPGFPITNLGRLDYQSPAASGNGSVRLDTSGGSTSLRLEPGVVAVFPSVQYAVGAMVRVDGLSHARPRLLARLLDEAGRPMPGTETSIVVERPINGWGEEYVPTLLKLPPAPEGAVSIQIDLDLLQPAHQNDSVEGEFQLWQEDYAGTVWFDDVVIVQLPSATLRTASLSSVFLQREQPELLADIRDLSGDPINIDLQVMDLDGRLVDRRLEEFGMGSREIRWKPKLPGLGWYQARLVVRVGDTPMLNLQQHFVWLPDPTPGLDASQQIDRLAPVPSQEMERVDRRRLGLVVPGGRSGSQYEQAADIIEQSGARAFFVPFVLPALDDATSTEATTRSFDVELARFITDLQSRLGAQGTIVLQAGEHANHEQLRSQGDRSLTALDNRSLWDTKLVTVVDRLAEALDRWHLGPLGSDVLAATPQAGAELDSITDRLSRLSPDPRVGVPWYGGFDPAGATLPEGTHRWSISVDAPAHANAGWVREVVQRLSTMLDSGTVSEGVIVLHSLDSERFGRRASVVRLADQVLAFWESLPSREIPTDVDTPESSLRLALADAWHWNEQRGESEIKPLLAAWRGMSDRLAGMRRIYTYENLDGVIASIYEPLVPRSDSKGGLLVVRAKPGHVVSHYEQFLGESPVSVYDVFGNRKVVEVAEVVDDHDGTPRMAHRIVMGDLPVFVEGVDTNLLMFIASIRLEPNLLEAIDIEHPAALVMRNPWPGVTSVRSRVVSPGGFGGQPVSQRAWEISPRLSDLLIEAGQEQRTPINIRFRRSEPAGRKSLGLDLDIRGENATRRVHVEVPFRIGLDYLDVTASARQTGDGVLVLAEIRNLGQRPVTLEATAIAPGESRRRAIVPQLSPGSTSRRELLLRGVTAADVGRIILAVEDVDVGARLNYQVDVP